MTKIEQLQSLLNRKKGKTYYANKLGISILELEQLLSQIKSLKIVGANYLYKEPIEKEETLTYTTGTFTEDYLKGTQEIVKNFKEPIRTLKQLIKRCKIDTKIWNIDRYVQNFWGTAENPSYQVKAFLSRKKPSLEEKALSILENYKTTYKPIPAYIQSFRSEQDVSVLISLSDPHIDKKTLDGSTIEQKCDKYLEVLEALLFKICASYEAEEIILVLGNDFFTSDSYHNTTTNLTPQAVTDDYDVSYEKGFELAVTAINKCKQFAPNVKVIFVPANHDRTKSFYLVHALEMYFKSDVGVIFDRTAENTKIHIYGQNFLGFHHGDTKMEALPLYFASKYKQEWGGCKYAEIALGDKHHKKQWSFKLTENEHVGTRMFIVPSLTTPDKWHKDKTYDMAIQAGVARIYDFDKGYVGEFEERI